MKDIVEGPGALPVSAAKVHSRADQDIHPLGQVLCRLARLLCKLTVFIYIPVHIIHPFLPCLMLSVCCIRPVTVLSSPCTLPPSKVTGVNRSILWASFGPSDCHPMAQRIPGLDRGRTRREISVAIIGIFTESRPKKATVSASANIPSPHPHSALSDAGFGRVAGPPSPTPRKRRIWRITNSSILAKTAHHPKKLRSRRRATLRGIEGSYISRNSRNFSMRCQPHAR